MQILDEIHPKQTQYHGQNTIAVHLESEALNFVAPFQAFLTLREKFGDEVYFLESLSGPVKDCRASMIGFGKLISIHIYQQRVEFTGLENLIAHVVQNCMQSKTLLKIEDTLHLTKAGLWNFLRSVEKQFAVKNPQISAGFNFGFFAYFGYDSAWFIENLPRSIPARSDVPDICLTIYSHVLQFDVKNQAAKMIYATSDLWQSPSPRRIKDNLQQTNLITSLDDVIPIVKNLQDSVTKSQYLSAVAKALGYIKTGDIYQVQLGHEISMQTAIDPLLVYQRLRQKNPSPYLFFAPFAAATLIGASPELFLSHVDGKVTLRPIAGTIKRQLDPAAESIAIEAFLKDTKEVAEHIMLVDLARNDIGRICQPNTLTADEFMVVEKYSHVCHMVSNVFGQALPGIDHYQMIAATFPEGTVSGAPKIRALEIIEGIETKRRGPYAGALGVIDFSGLMNLALIIRTIVKTGEIYHIRASAGIVADSVPEKEWQETIMKMAATYWALTNQELSDENIVN